MNRSMASVRWAFNFKAWKPSETEWTFCNQCIQLEERERIKKFYFTKDAKAAMVGRLLIRKLITEKSDIPYKDLNLSRTEKGKPYVTNKALKFDFNVSHQGDYSVIGAESGSKVGTDVMKLEPPRPSGVQKFFDTMRKQFSETEWKIIKSPDKETDQLKLFFRHWCLKESYVKALGVGIGFEINRLDFHLNTLDMSEASPLTDTTLKVDGVEQTDWLFEEHLLDDHCIAVAFQKSEQKISEAIKWKPPIFTVLDYETLINGAQPLSEPDQTYWNDFCHKPESPEQSYVKALGVGIGFEINRLDFHLNTLDMSEASPLTDTTLKVDGVEQTDWLFEEHLLDDHCIAVAFQKSEQKISEAIKWKPPIFTVLDYETLINGAQPLSEPDQTYWNDFCHKPESPEQLKNKS